MDLIELQHCLDQESASDLIKMLERSGIPYRRSDGKPSFDVSSLGSAGGPENARIIISVPRDKFHEARAALEAESLNQDLPVDHYLRVSTPEELQDIVSNEREWSAFDVAHARKILDELGVEKPDVQELTEKRLAALRRGKPASGKLLFFGWLFTLTGGFFGFFGIIALIGIGIGWSLSSMKEKTPEGDFLSYDRTSRKIGKTMMLTGIIMWLAWVSWWINEGIFQI